MKPTRAGWPFSLTFMLAGSLLSPGCGAVDKSTTTPISCGAGTHDVNGVCEEDAAVGIATGAGSYWRGFVPAGSAHGADLYLQLGSSDTGKLGLCTFADVDAVEPPNALSPNSTCTTPMTANALTMLSNITPNQIPTPTSFTANLTSSLGTTSVTFTLVSGDPGSTAHGVMPQDITWAEGTTSTALTISGCPYFGATTCSVMTR